MRCLLAALTLALLAPSLQAEIRFPSVIGDNMVLQRGEPVPVWGWDTAGTKVSVTIGETTVTATAGADGRWTAYLPTMKAGGPHEITVKGTSEATIKNVLVGEVWFCSGQSNMEWRVKQSNNADEEIAAAKHPRIRHIKFPHRPADNPQSDIPSDGWKVCAKTGRHCRNTRPVPHDQKQRGDQPPDPDGPVQRHGRTGDSLRHPGSNLVPG
jgi:sialate O-acetylesterase